MKTQTHRFVISVLVTDRTGILRDVTSALTDLGANIDGLRQSVLEGYFTLTLAATFKEARETAAVEKAIARNFPPGELHMIVRPFEAAMPPSAMPGGQTYIITLTGQDQPGILKRLTTCLAGKGINIEDWDTHYEGATVTYIGQVTVPPRLSIRLIQDELGALMADLGMRTTVQHQNIFRATNEIGPIRSLLKEAGRG